MEARLFEDTTVTHPRPADVVQMRWRGDEDVQSDLEVKGAGRN